MKWYVYHYAVTWDRIIFILTVNTSVLTSTSIIRQQTVTTCLPVPLATCIGQETLVFLQYLRYSTCLTGSVHLVYILILYLEWRVGFSAGSCTKERNTVLYNELELGKLANVSTLVGFSCPQGKSEASAKMPVTDSHVKVAHDQRLEAGCSQLCPECLRSYDPVSR